MAGALAPLLRASKVILFVDPYFSPDLDRFQRTLEAFAALVNRPARFEYYLRGARRNRPERPNAAEVFRAGLGEHCRFLPQGVTLSFLRWRERPEGEHLHARYIITNRGTVRIDNGLDEGPPGQTVPLTLLPYQEHQRCFRTFSETSNAFELLSPIFDLSSHGHVEQREVARL